MASKKLYIIKFTVLGEVFVWTSKKQGNYSHRIFNYNSIPMRRSETDIFNSMVKLNENKNIEPGKIFYII